MGIHIYDVFQYCCQQVGYFISYLINEMLNENDQLHSFIKKNYLTF